MPCAMIDEGADIIDIGGESTRPFSEPTPLAEELARIIPVIEAVRKHSDVPISVDTYKAAVARAALGAGADIINDISSLSFDQDMADVVAGLGRAGRLHAHKGDAQGYAEGPVLRGRRGRDQGIFCRKDRLCEIGRDRRGEYRHRSRHRLRKAPSG